MEMGWYCCRFMHFETLLKHFWNYLGPATSQSDRTANEVAEPYLALPLPAERAHVRAEPPTKKTEKKVDFEIACILNFCVVLFLYLFARIIAKHGRKS